MKRVGLILLWPFLITLIAGCKGFLEVKPLSSLAVLETLDDFKAVIQNETRMNGLYPFCYDYTSDYFYLPETEFNALDESGRNAYLWRDQPAHQNNWTQNYGRIYDANVVLDGIDQAQLGNWTERDRHEVRGTARFFKAFSLHYLATAYAPAYQAGNSSGKMGIPLRYSSDINEPSVRASLEETYRYIEKLLKEAAGELPLKTKEKTLPTKEAAWAVLARHYLNMQDYVNAERYADSCLAFNRDLLDYNKIIPRPASSHFKELNAEVIFHATRGDFSNVFSANRARVDSVLYQLYEENDLRKKLFYKEGADGSRRFYGDYAGVVDITSFAGLARDEVYLISAECLVRKGRIRTGIDVLNELLKNRIDAGAYVPLNVENQSDALDIILKERRKELAFRSGLRWMDLKRINLDATRSIVLTRQIGNSIFELSPNSVRYVFKIPDQIIAMSGIEQNP